MKTIKLPRKLKKRTKKDLLAQWAPVWLKIYGFERNFRRTGKPKVTSHTLGH